MAMPNPTIAPTMEWVVETGRDRQVANETHREAESRAERAPSRAIWGSLITSVDTMPFRMVSVTWDPIKAAPTIFNMPAIKIAWRRVMAFAPTAEAMELATSLAPMFQAI